MRWTVRQGNILDIAADVLICSANVYLNLSGGVGGEILLRYGDSMQRTLHEQLSKMNNDLILNEIWPRIVASLDMR